MSNYSRIVSGVNSVIEGFLTPVEGDDKSSHLRVLVLNRSLHKSEIFYTFESKINFVTLINDYVSFQSEQFGLVCDKSDWKNVEKNLRIVQRVRNKLAHEWLNFDSEDSHISFYKGTTQKTQVMRYNMDEEVQRSKEILDQIQVYSLNTRNYYQQLFNEINITKIN